MKTPNIVNMKFGSHLYGLATPNSDVDFKGVYLPSLNELLLGNYAKSFKHSTGNPHEKNQPGDVDQEVIALPTFIKFACDGETFAIDMLHCEEPLVSSDLWEELVSKRTKFYSRNLKAFVGYVKRQAAKYGVKGSRLADVSKIITELEHIKSATNWFHTLVVKDFKECLPVGEYAKWVDAENHQTGKQTFYEVNGRKYQDSLTLEALYNALKAMYDSYGHRAKLAEQNEGVDWKAVSHALRVAYQARDIYENGDFKYPLAETEFLLAVKQGRLDYTKEVAPVLESLVDEVDALANASLLPEKVDRNYWDQWLLDVYHNRYLR